MSHTSPSTLGACLTTLTLLALSALPSTAMAQDVQEMSTGWIAPSLGARVGGYGFRQLNEETNLINWENCRMNGVGVFGDFDLANTKFYSEISLDMYHAIATPLSQGIDRLSFHTQGAVGYRIPLTSWLVPNIHLGGGAEFTRVEIHNKLDRRIVPVGFAGIGGEIALKEMRFGMAIRSNVMQLPEYGWNSSNNTAKMTYRTEVAGQALFSMRYLL